MRRKSSTTYYQLNARKCTLSEEIDTEWLVEQRAILEQQQQEYDLVEEEHVEEHNDTDAYADDVS